MITAHTAERSGLGHEWERLELLGRCLALARRGDEPESGLAERLRESQDAVTRVREDGRAWDPVADPRLRPVDYDVLACSVGPEAEPRLGWFFQTLQPGSPQPYPTLALVQDLFALEAGEAFELHAATADHAPLRRLRLVETDGCGPYHPIRPAPGTTARLLGRSLPAPTPPGSVPVEVTAAWSDLVLPPDRLAILREFLARIGHRSTVFEEWGARGEGGPVALFSGPSGTGKTFAASVVAGELGWPLYRVDLGVLVSKYIGETEENLNRLFQAAHGRPVVLQFDEADSLFGKRGEIREARDRYANLEVSHLLARIEAHDGPCILTTNLRRNLDAAFIRRFQVVLEFPRPDPPARARLWRRLLPPRAPLAEDLDFEQLGEAINLTGGAIRNAALHAAFLAADAGRAIELGDIALAVWRELGKDGRELGAADLGPLAEHLAAGAHPSRADEQGPAPC